MKSKIGILFLGIIISCIKPNSQSKTNDFVPRKIDLINLIDSSFKNKRYFNNPSLIKLSKLLSDNFEEKFKGNCFFYLETKYSDQKEFLIPSIQVRDLFVFKYEKTGFLVFNRQTKNSLFFRFEIGQTIKQDIDINYLLACHYLNHNLFNEFSILKTADSIVIQKYGCDSKNFIVEQGKLPDDKFETNLFHDYNSLEEISKMLENNTEFKPYRKDLINVHYCAGPIFFLPSFDLPYEDPFD